MAFPSDEFFARVGESRLDEALRVLRPGLKSYVSALLGGNRQHADDVIQEVALHVWNNREKLPEIERFDRWVIRIAYFKAQSKRRDLARDRHVAFSDALFERIADEAAPVVTGGAERAVALRECLAQLADEDRRMLSRRYAEELPFHEIARLLGLNLAAVHQRFTRVRRGLRACMERRLSAGLAGRTPSPPAS